MNNSKKLVICTLIITLLVLAAAASPYSINADAFENVLGKVVFVFVLIVVIVLLKTHREITINLTKSRIFKAPVHFQACKLTYGGSALLVKVWEFNEWFRVGREYSYIQNTQENACLEIYAYDMKNGFFKLFLVTTC